MSQYNFKVKDLDGNVIIGTLEADSEEVCIENLRQKNYYILNIREKDIKKDVFESLHSNHKVDVKDIAIFCRQFSTLIDAGIPIVTSLATIIEQTENKRLKKTLSKVYDNVLRGSSLSASMRMYPDVFPMILFNMVEAGEVSGTLDNILNDIASHFEKENNLNQKIRSAMTYPIIVSIVSVLVVIFLVTNVLPIFVSMFKNAGAQLPLPTIILIGFSQSILQYWYLYMIGIILTVFIIIKLLGTKVGRRFYDHLLLKIPILGPLNKKVITSRFTRTLGTLICSGIPLIEAMCIIEKIVGNTIVSDGIKNVEEDIKRGKSLGEPLKEIEIFSPMVIQMINVGEKSGSLDNMLKKTADFYDNEVDTAVSQMTTLIEPLIIVVLSIVVGFILISIVMPMFQIYNFIGE